MMLCCGKIRALEKSNMFIAASDFERNRKKNTETQHTQARRKQVRKKGRGKNLYGFQTE